MGQSYWVYLSNLDDLVILTDEAHRYHADRSKNAINELKPILGLELTATPLDDNNNQFKNIVYEYSLAQALADGKYVKNPAIAKRKDFQPGSMSDRELEIAKLEDAINIDYRNMISPTSWIPRYIFHGFEKACYFEYKFDSKTERDLAFILENDKPVIKWQRPSPNQFRIYWDYNSKRYEPGFIIETAVTIYMLETKMSTQVESLDVQAKKQAAEKYCKHATDYTSQNGGKPWKYDIIPHSSVTRTNSFVFMTAQFIQ